MLNDLAKDGLYSVAVGEIINSQWWTPGDYIPEELCSCSLDDEYHNCHYKDEYPIRWQQTLTRARSKAYFDKLKERVICEGFIEPLAAKVSLMGNCFVLVDGHTRLSIAQDLDMKYVTVYIGSKDMPYDDLVAIDSGYWDLMKDTSGNWRVDRPWARG